MADPFGILGAISLTFQITQALLDLGLGWHDAPHDVKVFLMELENLRPALSQITTNLAVSLDFTNAFEGKSSLLLSQLGSKAPPATVTKTMIQTCTEDLNELLAQLRKMAKGHRVGWERIKGAFLSKRLREAVENLHRQCQSLNGMVSIDTALLTASTNNEVREARKEQQEARLEQHEARQEQREAFKKQWGWHETEMKQKMLAWLTPLDYTSQQNDLIGRWEKGTGQWLLNSPQFQSWLDGNDQTLFCPGIPGAGKTICSAIVINDLHVRFGSEASVGIAYLYCNFRRQQEQKPDNLLASLLKHLVQKSPSIPASLLQLYEQRQNSSQRLGFDEISEILRSLIQIFSKTYIVVDALDECHVSQGDRHRFLTELFSLQQELNVKLLVTSRDIPEIKNYFSKSLVLEIRASEDDVWKYLNSQVSRLPSFVSNSIPLQQEITRQITSAVDGMYVPTYLPTNA